MGNQEIKFGSDKHDPLTMKGMEHKMYPEKENRIIIGRNLDQPPKENYAIEGRIVKPGDKVELLVRTPSGNKEKRNAIILEKGEEGKILVKYISGSGKEKIAKVLPSHLR